MRGVDYDDPYAQLEVATGPGGHCDDCGVEFQPHDPDPGLGGATLYAPRKYGDRWLCALCKREALKYDFGLRDVDLG